MLRSFVKRPGECPKARIAEATSPAMRLTWASKYASGGSSSPLARSSALYRSLIWSRLRLAALARTAWYASPYDLPLSVFARLTSAPGQVHCSRQVCLGTAIRVLVIGQSE